MKSFIEEIFNKATVEHVEHSNSELAKTGREIKYYFESILGMLCDFDQCPNVAINRLCQLAWNLIGCHMVPTVVASHIQIVSFLFEKKGDKEVALIMLPTDFAQRCKDDPYMQFGALVFLASQARDFYNGLIPPEDEVKRRLQADAVHKRAQAYEAEFLLTAQQKCNDFTPNDYQKEVLKRFPKGLDSLSEELRYESKPFMPGEKSPLVEQFPPPPQNQRF